MQKLMLVSLLVAVTVCGNLFADAGTDDVVVLKGHDNGVGRLAMSPDGKLLVSTGDKSKKVIVWDLSSGQAVCTIDIEDDGWSSIAFHPTKPIIACASYLGKIQLWNYLEQKKIVEMPIWDKFICSLAFSSDGSFLYAGYVRAELRRIDFKKKEVIHKSELFHRPWTMSIAAEKNIGVIGAFPGDKGHAGPAISFFDTETGILKRVVLLSNPMIRCSAMIVSENKAVLGGRKSQIWICDLDEMDIVKTIQSGSLDISSMSVTSVPGIIVTGETGELETSKEGDANKVVGECGRVKFWDINSGRELHSIAMPGLHLSAVATSPNSKYIAYGGYGEKGGDIYVTKIDKFLTKAEENKSSN